MPRLESAGRYPPIEVMAKLVAPHMERCIGCLLCVLCSSRARGSISLEDSAIRIYFDGTSFSAQVDAGLPVSEEIVKICPRNCLALTEDQ